MSNLRSNIGILIAVALATIFLAIFFLRASPRISVPPPALAHSIQTLRLVQSEKFQSDLRFAESNAEAALLVGGMVKLGRIEGAEPIVELNVREGGVIELLLDANAKEGQRRRVIYLPQIDEPLGVAQIQWQCYSANWPHVSELAGNCLFDKNAGEFERRHVTRLHDAIAKSEQEAERQRANYEAEKANADFERQRAQLSRESERARQEEERQRARLEREVERARIEYERQRQQ